ncbi:uncharacterized protein LOC119377190 [Rhipicephalus sanguineus]|uniref:uncharacterized protein LOC119377190 n=1 Tax=Rhipicephalus sanguineus TaxID=34632 RepID=UPI0018940E3A|nr:uncharacterized protein LOC119377190 [Rhipicephalus sanguineus]
MFSFALAVCMMFAANTAARSDPDAYAEDPKHVNEQKLSALTDLEGALFIRKRDYRKESPFHCHYAKKLRNNGDGTFTYELGAIRKGNTKYGSFEVVVTPMTTGDHKEENAASYQESPNEVAGTHKIVTMNDERTCFLLSLQYGSSNVCILLMTAETVGSEVIPEPCNSVYEQYCGESIEIYQSHCSPPPS